MIIILGAAMEKNKRKGKRYEQHRKRIVLTAVRNCIDRHRSEVAYLGYEEYTKCHKD